MNADTTTSKRNYYLRPVALDDLMLIYEWANDQEVRNNSFNQDAISLENHKQWFESKITDAKCFFYILIYKNTPVGQIRVDVEDGTGYISYSIAKEYRAQGFGRLMLQELENKIKSDSLPIDSLVAEVKIDNIASQKKFEEAGFKKIELIRYRKDLSIAPLSVENAVFEPDRGGSYS